MELKDLKKIVELMKSNELTEFEFQDNDTRIALKRKNGSDAPVVVHGRSSGSSCRSPHSGSGGGASPCSARRRRTG